MFRYLALIWNPRKPEACAAAKGISQDTCTRSAEWQEVFGQPGIVVYVAASKSSHRSYPISARSGVILGRAFRYSDGGESSSNTDEFEPLTTWSNFEVAQIVSSGGRDLSSLLWGQYVAFIHDPLRASTWVFRDPSGHLPCAYIVLDQVHVLFSRVSDVPAAALESTTIDWHAIAVRAAMGRFAENESTLREVVSLEPGEALRIDGGNPSTHVYWSPFNFCAPAASDEDFEAASCKLRRVTRACVRAWSTCHSNALLELSGGLDSSIVLSMYPSTGASSLQCVNFVTSDAESDELEFARLAAATKRVPLIERQRKNSVDLAELRNLDLSIGPVSRVLHSLDTQPTLRAIALEVGASAIFNGEGGDEVFNSIGTLLAPIDYARANGIDCELKRLVKGSSESHSIPLLQLWWDVISHGLLRRRLNLRQLLIGRRRLLNDDVLRAPDSDPWRLPERLRFEDVDAPGKICHALLVNQVSYRFYDPLSGDDYPETLSPLTSQPIVEASLHIPLHIQAAGGRDRSLARRAFSNDLPKAIAERYSKGDIKEHVLRTVDLNRNLLKEVLVGGHLVKERILDAKRVERSFDNNGRDTLRAIELLDYACIEMWLAQWI